jgi:hypothetical protein
MKKTRRPDVLGRKYISSLRHRDAFIGCAGHLLLHIRMPVLSSLVRDIMMFHLYAAKTGLGGKMSAAVATVTGQ